MPSRPRPRKKPVVSARRKRLPRVSAASIAHSTTIVADVLAALPRAGVRAAFQTIVTYAQALTGAKYVALGIGSDPDRPFEPWVFSGIPDEVAARIGRNPRAVGLLGAVARAGKTIRTPDLQNHPEFRGFPESHPPMKSLLGVPIFFEGLSVGNLYLADKDDGTDFTDVDQQVIESLTLRVGAAIQTARLFQAESQERQWLQTVLDQMPEGVIVLDEDGRITTCNGVAKQLARNASESVPDPFGNTLRFDLRNPDGTPLAWEETPFVRALQQRQTVMSQEFKVRDHEGLERTVMICASPVLDEQRRRSQGAVQVFQDISQLKEMERLRQEWTSLIAHDLRQPAQVIRLNAQLLMKSAGPSAMPTVAKSLEHILSASGRLNRLINDLLDSSRIETKNLQLKCRLIDVAEVIRGSMERIFGPSQGRPIRFIDHGEGAQAWADPDRVEQILQNLLENALKYGRAGTEILLSLERTPQGAHVAVTNEGPGIPPHEIPTLFDRFTRTKQTLASRTQGLGLGLYICKGIVEAHGGRIWAESVPGQTTTFHFELPLKSAIS